MSDKLGFTFYPKDWWTSESYFELEPIERYIYLECLFVMYSNDGFMKTQKTQMERRITLEITQEQWVKITSKFTLQDGMFTDKSVNKRLRKAIANRENGSKGGRPKKEQVTEEEKPKKPNLETQNNPPLERERERESELKNKENNKKGFTISKLSVSQSVEVFNLVKAFFLDLYATQFKTEYYFQAKDGKKIQDLLKKTFFKMKERSNKDDFTILEISEATNLILKASLELEDKFIASNFNLSIIDSKFNEIYTSLKNGQKRNSNTAKPISKYATAK